MKNLYTSLNLNIRGSKSISRKIGHAIHTKAVLKNFNLFAVIHFLHRGASWMYLIGQKFVEQKCRNFSLVSKILSDETFCPSKILSNISIQKSRENRTKLSKFRLGVENFVGRNILSEEILVFPWSFRCMQLWEPDKETLFTKSGESWQMLLSQLRQLLLESFSRHLDSFEDRVRVMREKYADPNWPFLKYFLVHVSNTSSKCV